MAGPHSNYEVTAPNRHACPGCRLIRPYRCSHNAAERGQTILAEPPPALTNLDSDDLARLDEILSRLQTGTRAL